MTPVDNTAPAYRHLVHRLSDPDAFGLVLPGTDMSVDFLLPQKLPALAEQFHTSQWSMEFYDTNVKARVRGPLPPGWACVGLALSPSPSKWHHEHAEHGTFICIPPGEPFDGHIVPGFACGSVYVPPATWEQCRELSGVERESYGRTSAHRLAPPLWNSIERQLRAARKALRSAALDPRLAPDAMQDAVSFVRRIMTLAWESPSVDWQPCESLRNRGRLARRAEAWMLDRLDEQVQVPDVCLALRVSRRELEYAFRLTFDESPRDHLQALRLNSIHRALCRAGEAQETVAQVALDHGVTHLSRFAAQYRRLFGEGPGVTLRRR